MHSSVFCVLVVSPIGGNGEQSQVLSPELDLRSFTYHPIVFGFFIQIRESKQVIHSLDSCTKPFFVLLHLLDQPMQRSQNRDLSCKKKRPVLNFPFAAQLVSAGKYNQDG